MLFNKKIKYVGTIIFCIVLAMVFHIIMSKYSTIPKAANWSLLVRKIGFILTTIVWYFIAYGCIAYIFYRYKGEFLERANKGIRYGIAVAVLWILGMLQGVLLFGNPPINEFITGVCDGVPIIIMFVVIGKFTVKNDKCELNENRNVIVPIIVFSAVFLIERYLLYLTGSIIMPGYKTRPFLNFIWTLIMGDCIGAMYVLIYKEVNGLSKMKFGIIIFGVNWLVFNLFMPLIFTGYFHDFIIIMCGDIIGAVLSCSISEYLQKCIITYKLK